MLHLLVFCYMAAFGTGVVAATLAYQTYRQHRYRYLRDYFLYLVLMNVIVGIYLAFVYLAANIPVLSAHEPTVALSIGCELLGLVLVATFVYKLIVLMRGFSGTEPSSRLQIAYIAGFAILVSGYLAFLWLMPGRLSPDRVNLLAAFIYLALAAAAIVALLLTIISAGSLVQEHHRRAVRIFAGIHLAIYLLNPCVLVLPDPYSWYAISIGFMVLSLVPLIYLRGYLLGQKTSYLLRPEQAEVMGAFVAGFGISRREGEIVHLVLAGKTNAEISDILFISPNTVKNHIYSVYRKAGVRNRVELTNLIIERGIPVADQRN